jgi:hypothetical protein
MYTTLLCRNISVECFLLSVKLLLATPPPPLLPFFPSFPTWGKVIFHIVVRSGDGRRGEEEEEEEEEEDLFV